MQLRIVKKSVPSLMTYIGSKIQESEGRLKYLGEPRSLPQGNAPI
jgi:hypothetical protein